MILLLHFASTALGKRVRRRLLAACGLVVAASPVVTRSGAAAEPVAREISTVRARTAPVVTVYVENDSFTGTDQHYTNGLKISWLSAELTAWGHTGWRQSLLDHLPFVPRLEGQKDVGMAFGQNIYTPRDIKARNPDREDRPYAGWAYFEFDFITKTPAIMDNFAIQIGVVGPHSYAEETQTRFHRLIGIGEPHGWDYQLRDELGVNVIYERRWRLYGRAFDDSLGLDFVPHAGVSVGNVQTYANTGGTVRVGYQLPSDFGVQLSRGGSVGGSPADDRDPRVAHDRNLSFFLFAAVDGRAVARDLFLDGNTFRHSRSVTKEDLVADLSAGVGLVAGRWQLTFTHVRRTREFEAQAEPFNNFGSFTLSRAF
ncbi:MAG: lipid A deacylase LpxR family protein [Opitutaceae bacterium]